MTRKLVAALACRAGGSRLYGKPLQPLVPGKTVLDQILDTIDALSDIETAVLGISEGVENLIFVDIAKQRGIPYILGDERDVLQRLVDCGRVAGATDVFRVTTECPFLWTEPFEQAWYEHVNNNHDITVTDGLPEGAIFEIYTQEALEQSHAQGDKRHRSEMCSLYARENAADFRLKVILPTPDVDQPDIRLTVDNAEDLVLCREIYKNFEDQAPLIPLAEIIRFLDERPAIKELAEPYLTPVRIWPNGNVA